MLRDFLIRTLKICWTRVGLIEITQLQWHMLTVVDLFSSPLKPAIVSNLLSRREMEEIHPCHTLRNG